MLLTTPVNLFPKQKIHANHFCLQNYNSKQLNWSLTYLFIKQIILERLRLPETPSVSPVQLPWRLLQCPLNADTKKSLAEAIVVLLL